MKKEFSADGIVKNEKIPPDMSALMLDERYTTVIFLVRHGQSIGNERREFLGHTDKDLSSLGYVQAERTAEFLKGQKIDVVYSSDLLRAHNTAAPNAKIRGLEVNDSKELREMYAGAWEGMRIEDIISQYPSEFIDGWRGNYGVFVIPGGESVPHTADRLYCEIYNIAKANEGKHIFIGCHAAAIRSLWAKISGIPYAELASTLPFPTNASVSVIYFDGERLIPAEYSHDAHLSDLY